jgi:hypothetical protein
MSMMRRTASRITLAIGAAALGAAVLTFGTGGQASTDPAVRTISAAGIKGDRLCGTDHWPPTEATCLQAVMAKSGRGVTVRLVGEGATVVERPMTDRERLQAAFAAFETRVTLADRR